MVPLALTIHCYRIFFALVSVLNFMRHDILQHCLYKFYHLHKLTHDPSFCKSSTSVTQGQLPKMAIKKNNPFTGSRLSGIVSDKNCLQAKDSSRGQDFSVLPTGSLNDEQLLFRSSGSMSSSGHRTFFNDPAQVRQWAANSATGSDTIVDVPSYRHCSASYGIDPSMTTAAPQIPGCVSALRSDVSHVSFQHLTHMPETNGAGSVYDPFSPTSAGNTASPIDPGLGFHQFQDIDSSVGVLEEQYPRDFWQFPTTGTDDVMFASQVAPSSLAMGGHNGDSGYRAGWSMAPIQAGDKILSTGVSSTAYPMACSPLSAVDPSVSSSFSQSSFLGPQPNTPISPAFQEGTWPAEQNGTLEENALFPAFTIGESTHGSLPSGCLHEQVDLQRFVKLSMGPFRWSDTTRSTLKAPHPFQRTPISNMKMWPQPEAPNQEPMSSPFMEITCQRRSSEGEASTAREHPLYQVGPSDDGLYHCPFAGKEDCSHKPEKLKCNYE